MSFILDALKKSEAERQQQTGAEFTRVPASTAPRRRAGWVWIVGALLLINLAVMVGILLRPSADVPADTSKPAPTTPPVETATPQPAPASTFADQVAAARETRSEPAAGPADDSTSPESLMQPALAETGQLPAAPVTREPVPQQPVATGNSVPTIDELRLDGRIDLPELRIDIHVYSDNPAERFVFINMVKHRERSLLPEGPAIREIRADGVILEHRGQVFLLPRQ